MKKIIFPLIILVLAAFISVNANSISLFSWGFNANGDLSEGFTAPSALPAGFNDASFDWGTGLGTISMTFNPGGAGNFYILSFFDHDLDLDQNDAYNEYGASHGTADAGLTWEIDEPGFVYGDIYDNFTAKPNTGFDNTNSIGDPSSPFDVSMGMGWNFYLNQDQYAALTFVISDAAPSSGFYLEQHDASTGGSNIFFSSGLQILGKGTQQVPEPSMAGLFSIGMASLFFSGLIRRKSDKEKK